MRLNGVCWRDWLRYRPTTTLRCGGGVCGVAHGLVYSLPCSPESFRLRRRTPAAPISSAISNRLFWHRWMTLTQRGEHLESHSGYRHHFRRGRADRRILGENDEWDQQ